MLRGKAFNLHFTVRVAGNGNMMIRVVCLDCKKGERARQTGCSSTSPGSVSVSAFRGSIINDKNLQIDSCIIVLAFFLSLKT